MTLHLPEIALLVICVYQIGLAAVCEASNRTSLLLVRIVPAMLAAAGLGALAIKSWGF